MLAECCGLASPVQASGVNGYSASILLFGADVKARPDRIIYEHDKAELRRAYRAKRNDDYTSLSMVKPRLSPRCQQGLDWSGSQHQLADVGTLAERGDGLKMLWAEHWPAGR
jgi:hypothetical protein